MIRTRLKVFSNNFKQINRQFEIMINLLIIDVEFTIKLYFERKIIGRVIDRRNKIFTELLRINRIILETESYVTIDMINHRNLT